MRKATARAWKTRRMTHNEGKGELHVSKKGGKAVGATVDRRQSSQQTLALILSG